MERHAARYFQWAHKYLWQYRRIRAVNIKCHSIENSLLEGMLSRGDRRTGRAIELAWQRGAAGRLERDADADRWWQAFADSGIDVEQQLHQPYQLMDHLPGIT